MRFIGCDSVPHCSYFQSLQQVNQLKGELVKMQVLTCGTLSDWVLAQRSLGGVGPAVATHSYAEWSERLPLYA